ncbi:histidine phosphatase family protein [Stenotrophomonas sp. ESTM1D_MKCIP4_1]|uniref:histidine phosphatase family protein n=1 Tax=Stenotrophomonas sp. ESTM1D_MKCIP4_1 TaxID=2072414 RepID=UPI000D540F27|nr:histidine phosphatase family protein [Stenotrophomonas sp. ESTM1D_MKCIP4_1]AWH53499.1 histidine phosphatase family protein [Stenotrophomonas sp. ESTM1D_MKCIP4_1]
MIILVRHAESAANAGLPTDSPDGIALTALGERQAGDFAKEWAVRPSAIVSSPFLRAMQTAEPLARRFDLPVETASVQEFTYLSPSKCIGTTAASRRAWVLEYWDLSDPDLRDGPGAETFREFVERARGFLVSAGSRSSGNVIVFCHGQFMQMVRWLQEEPARPVDSESMRHFRAMDLERQVKHCQQYQLVAG